MSMGIWHSWTPTVTQSGSVTVTVTFARFSISGNTVHVEGVLVVTGSGTAGNAITIGGLPAAITPRTALGSGADVETLGTASVLDQGTAAYYGFLVWSTTSAWHIRDSNTRSNIGVSPSFALANTDVITFRGSYERV